MIKIIFRIIIVSLIVLTLPLTAKDSGKAKVEGKALTGVSIVNYDQESSKFSEYRDIPSGFIFSIFEYKFDTPELYINFNASGIQQSDERYNIAVGRYGKFKIDFQWDKTPHRYSYNAKTLYNEGDPGVLLLSDQIQNELQNTIGNHGEQFAQGVDLLSGYLTGAHQTGLAIIRKKGTFNLAYNVSEPFKLNVKIQREKKEGTRAIGATLGFGNIMELPEPVDHLTTQVEATLSYSKKRTQISAGYYLSVFDNNLQSLKWDNPYRITDNNPSTFAYLFGNGSASGQMSLPPSNSAHEIFFNGVFRLAKRTKLNTSFSYGILSQNEKMLPYTVNSGLAQSYSMALNSPRSSSDTKVNTTSASLTLNSRLSKDVKFKLGYKYYDYNNNSSSLSLPGYALMDQVWINSSNVIQPYGYKRSAIYGNLSVSKIKNSVLKIGYKYKTIERKLGSEDKGKTSEGIIDLSLNSNPFSWLSIQGSYNISKRDWSLEGKKDLYILRETNSFNFRRYHEADRDRNGLNFLVTISPFKNIDLSTSYIVANDEYKNSEYGLKSNDFYSLTIDLNYRFSDNNIFVFYSNEEYTGFQSARETTMPPYESISLDPNDDWNADLSDKIDTFGMGLKLNLIKDKINFDLTYTYSKAEGTANFTIPEEGNIGVVTNFDQGVDSSSLHIAQARLTYKLSSQVSLILGHLYEQFELDDITSDDLQVDMLNEGFAFYLGALEPDYKYNVTYLQVLFSW